jgi:pimeloyl-ACP methyl ester carboxylesterase
MLCAVCLVGASPDPASTTWTVIAIDLKGDGRGSAAADAAQLSYRYDKADDVLWFRVATYGPLPVDGFDVQIAVDTGATGHSKTKWWGAGNNEFVFDRLVIATVTRSGGVRSGAIGIGDAAAGPKPSIALQRDDAHVRVDGNAVVIGIRRSELTDSMTMKVVAALGANDVVIDDIPNARPPAIDLLAPRPARGLREIDTSRDNFVFAKGQAILRDSSRPRVIRRGRGPTAVILIPGVYSGTGVFDSFIARNSSRYTFHTITPPGLDGTRPRVMPPLAVSYGEATWTHLLAHDVLDVIHREHLAHPIIVTHGFPGSLAVEELALSHPTLLGGIVEIASQSVQPYTVSSTPPREATPDERITIVDESWARQWFRYVTPETWESNNYAAEMFANDPAKAERARLQTEAVPLPVKIRYLIEFMASDRRAAFGGMEVPVLILRPGFSDAVLSNASFAWFKASYLDGWNAYPVNPLIERITIPDARALILEDQPALADNAIAAFVERALSRVRNQEGGGIRNVFFTYSMLARVSATRSFVGELVSRTYQPR